MLTNTRISLRARALIRLLAAGAALFAVVIVLLPQKKQTAAQEEYKKTPEASFQEASSEEEFPAEAFFEEAAEPSSQEQLIFDDAHFFDDELDGFYIMDIYSRALTPTDGGIYAEGDIYQYITLPKDALEGVKVGDSFDLSRFHAGMGYVQRMESSGEIFIASEDEASEENCYGGICFYYRADQGQWLGTNPLNGALAVYKTGYGKVLFTPETEILDYLSVPDPLSGEAIRHSDIRDFFVYSGLDRAHEKVNLTVLDGVVIKAEVMYHP